MQSLAWFEFGLSFILNHGLSFALPIQKHQGEGLDEEALINGPMGTALSRNFTPLARRKKIGTGRLGWKYDPLGQMKLNEGLILAQQPISS